LSVTGAVGRTKIEDIARPGLQVRPVPPFEALKSPDPSSAACTRARKSRLPPRRGTPFVRHEPLYFDI